MKITMKDSDKNELLFKLMYSNPITEKYFSKQKTRKAKSKSRAKSKAARKARKRK